MKFGRSCNITGKNISDTIKAHDMDTGCGGSLFTKQRFYLLKIHHSLLNITLIEDHVGK